MNNGLREIYEYQVYGYRHFPTAAIEARPLRVGLPGQAARLISTSIQLGYAFGLWLPVPLGDQFERRRLISVQFVILAVALLAVAAAPSAVPVLGASLLVGICATVAQQIVPLAANLAAPERRGSAVGNRDVRPARRHFAEPHLGRLRQCAFRLAGDVLLYLSVPRALAAGALMALHLPRSQPQTAIRYPARIGGRFLVNLWTLDFGRGIDRGRDRAGFRRASRSYL